jgi:RNA polymerase sigma-70 factor (ECF subfamily)
MVRLTVIDGVRPDTAFEAMLRPHFDVLYGRAHRLTGNAADAEDLVQELCIRVFPRVDELAGLDNPRAWLMRVLYRLFVDLARSKQRSPIRCVDIDHAEEYLQAPSGEPGPEQQTEALLQHERLQRAWQYLDGEQRALLALQAIEGHSLAEMETITGMPQGTLKSRLHRARARLGRLLEREETVAGPKDRGSDGELPTHRKSAG